MPRPRLTIDDARTLNFADLSDRGYGLLAEYEAPGTETPDELENRISRTLDEVPDLYAWFNQLWSHFDHWTDFYAGQGGTGQSNTDYKSMRERRDLMEKLASSAKLRYEATSRRLTQIHKHEDEAKMPRGRA